MDRGAPVAETDGLDGGAEEQRDRPFKPERRARTDAAKRLVGRVVERLEGFEREQGLRLRARRPSDQKTFCATVEAVVCEALHRHFTAPGGWIAVTLSKRVLARKDRYRSTVLGKQLPDVLARLSMLELLEVRKGAWSERRQSTVRAAPSLIDLARQSGIALADVIRETPREIILLRGPKERHDKKGPLLKYRETAQTTRYREQLNAINEWLGKADIRFEGGSDVDSGDRQLSRTFNDGSFERGGRLNGGFWLQLGAYQRLRGLRIGGETVVELDYGQIGTRIIYGIAGAALPPGDLYAVSRFALPSGVGASLDLNFPREGVKRVLNAMVYASKPLSRFPKDTRKYFPKDDIGYVVGRIAEHHKGIGPLFFKGYGLRAMWIESELLIEVLLQLRDRGVVALPVHDAVVVPQSAYQPSKEAMLSTFRRYAAVEGKVNASAWFHFKFHQSSTL